MDIDGASVEANAADLRARGTEVSGLRVDVADRASVEAAVAMVTERFGRCDVVGANVGVQQFGAIDALTEQDWQWVMSVNSGGIVGTVAAFLPLHRAATGRRHIVLASSARFFQIGVRMAAYIA